MVDRAQETLPQLEQLESRLLLSITNPLTVGQVGTFVDAGGNTIHVRLTGKAGTVNFTDTALNAGVVDGNDIATAAITGASSDFVMTVVDDDSTAAGNGVVELGDVTSNKLIAGLLTTGGSAGHSAFLLGSFTGPGLTNKGAIVVNEILGNAGGVALSMPSLALNATIQVNFITNAALAAGIGGNETGSILGDVDVAGNWSGALNVTNNVTGDINIGGSVLNTGAAITIGSTDSGDVNIARNMAGLLSVGNPTGLWTIGGTVNVHGQLQSGTNWDLAIGEMDGKVTAGGNVTLAVAKNIGDNSTVVAFGDLIVTVGGNVGNRAQLTDNVGEAGGALTATVAGSSAGYYVAGLDMDVTVGSVLSGKFQANGSLDLTTTGTGKIANATVSSYDPTFIEAGGAITNLTVSVDDDVTIYSDSGNSSGLKVSANGSLELGFAGNVSNSTFSADSDITNGTGATNVAATGIAGSATKVNLLANDGDVGVDSVTPFTIGKGFFNGSIAGMGSDAFVTVLAGGLSNASVVSTDVNVTEVTGNVTNGTFTAVHEDLTLTIHGNYVSGQATGNAAPTAGGVSAAVTVDGSVGNKVQITAYGHGGEDNLVLTVGGVFSGNATAPGFGLQSIVPGGTDFVTLGSMNNGGLNLGESVVKVLGNVKGGYIKGDTMDLTITGSVDAKSSIQAGSLLPFADDPAADTIGFFVGGSFNGRLDTGFLITGVDLATDTADATATLVGGPVSNTGKINIVGYLAGANELVFGHGMGGLLTIGSLSTPPGSGTFPSSNLTVMGDASKITITKRVTSTIDILGKLAYLKTGSLFSPTSNLGGIFLDGDGVATGGTLTTGKGFLSVNPIV